MSEIDTRITPALHPDTIKGLDGYSEQTKSHVALIETAFSEAYEGVRSVYEAKAAAARNPTMNDAAKLIQVDDFANKKMARVLRSLDTASVRLDQASGSWRAS